MNQPLELIPVGGPSDRLWLFDTAAGSRSAAGNLSPVAVLSSQTQGLCVLE